MNEQKQRIKIGDRVIVAGWMSPVAIVRVARFFWEDSNGDETEDPKRRAVPRLGLEWTFPDGSTRMSKVSLHDEGERWYLYSEAS